MIKIDKDYDNTPAHLTSDTVENKINNGKWGEAYSYRHDDVVEALETIYHKKCAYCESKRKNAPLQVEHFRPKKEVTEDATHEGYFWLSYEWSNLLLACSDCNSQGNKGNHFPIEKTGTRITVQPNNRQNWCADAQVMLDEKALLLNPELDEPSEHLEVSSGDCKIKGITEKGKKSIEIYGLNRNTLQLDWRKKAVDDIFGAMEIDVKALYDLIEEGKIPEKFDNRFFRIIYKYFDKIKENQSPEREYSFVFRTFYKNFDEFLEKQGKASFEPKHKEFLKKAFKQYKESH